MVPTILHIIGICVGIQLIQATEYLDDSTYDPWLVLSFSSALIVPQNVSTITQINNMPTTVQWTRAFFGGNVLSPSGSNSGSDTFHMVVATPIQACEPLQHPVIHNATQDQINNYYQGKIVLTLSRGTPDDCDPGVKAAMSERVGAVLHLLTMSNLRSGLYANVFSEDPLSIPTGTLDWSTGYTIIQSMSANPNVTVMGTVPTTGPADPNDIAAVTTIIRNWNAVRPLFNFVSSEYGAAGQADWTLFLNDSTIVDPCLHRLLWTTCVGGRITRFDWFNQGIKGTFDPTFGQFTALQVLDLSYNQIIGPMPCAWGALVNLQVLSLGQTGLTSLSECMGGMISLEWALMGFNHISNLPPALGQLHNIRVISLDTCNISAPMIDISNWTKLEFFDFNQNYITGSLQSLQFAQQTLTRFFFTDNLLSGTLPSNVFDNMPNLLKVDLGRNRLIGSLPNFNNSHKLIDLGLDHNTFSGGIPATWNMPSLISFRGSHNQLSGSLLPLSSFISMTSIDLSWNVLYVPAARPSSLPDRPASLGGYVWSDVIIYLSDCLPPSIQIINLAHNQLNGTWSAIFLTQKNITQVYMSFNNLTHLNGQSTFLITTALASLITVYDLSNNPLMTGTLGQVGPTPTLQVLKLNGCPLLRDRLSNPPALPPYITTDPSAQVTKSTADQPFSCPALTGKNYPLQVSLDPSYYSYAGCICDQGTYGMPPDCLVIPISTNTTAWSGLITDDIYGSSRMSIGIDTAWAIGNVDFSTPIQNISSVNSTSAVRIGNSNSTSAAVAVYITVTFESSFVHYSDIIDMYAGQTLQGVPVISVRGTDSRPFASNQPEVVTALGYPQAINNVGNTSITTYVVFASFVTLNFRSRQTFGKHFIANFTMSAVCPPGWKQVIGGSSAQTMTCQVNLPIYSLPFAIQNLIYTVSALVLVIITAAMVVMLIYRRTVIFRAASIRFCVLILLCAALLSVGSILYVVSPGEYPNVCGARIWLSTLSLVGLLGGLLTKANRIRHLFTDVSFNAMKQAVKTTVVIRSLLGMLGVQLVLLISLSSANLTHPQLTSGTKFTAGYDVYSCTSVETGSYMTWLVVQLTYVGVFLVKGLYIAFAIRKVPSAFNESSHIVHSLHILSLLSIILVPLNFIVDDNPGALAVIRGLGQNLVAISMTIAIFGSKFYYLYEGRADDKSLVQTAVMPNGTVLKQANMPSTSISNEKTIINASLGTSKHILHSATHVSAPVTSPPCDTQSFERLTVNIEPSLLPYHKQSSSTRGPGLGTQLSSEHAAPANQSWILTGSALKSTPQRVFSESATNLINVQVTAEELRCLQKWRSNNTASIKAMSNQLKTDTVKQHDIHITDL